GLCRVPAADLPGKVKRGKGEGVCGLGRIHCDYDSWVVTSRTMCSWRTERPSAAQGGVVNAGSHTEPDS
ncbi:hypothetical protein T11_7114, partial [Trichinella zimbabwensis]